jgi:hypothetical protein
MSGPGTELYEAIRRDHRAGMRLPRELAARHGVSRQAVMDALSWIEPISSTPQGIDLSPYERTLDELLREDAARPLAQRRTVFEFYSELERRHHRLPVSYRWVWDYVTGRRTSAGQTPSPGGPDEPEPPAGTGRTWAQTVPCDTPGFITDLITSAARHLTELKIEAGQSAEAAVELGLVSTGQALALVGQAMNELALLDRGSGISYAQISAWSGVPDLARQVEDYHRLMTL